MLCISSPMCPSSCIPSLAENENWTDEAIFTSMINFNMGKPLALNVTSDVNPYQYRPSDLAVDMWYLCSGEKTDAECGLWVQTGDPREIFSDSGILGLRTTLQFYEGQGPHGRKTEWMMQEYRLSEKCDNNTKDHRALCRVFMADDYKPPSTHCIADTDVKINGPTTISNVNCTGYENTSDMDCILSGDYIELNDLIDQGSCSSSSAISSCLTMTSDEYFDSMALLQELDKDILEQEMKHSSVEFNISAPLKTKEAVIGSVRSETSKAENRNESPYNGLSSTPSSGSTENISEEGMEEGVRRTKRRKVMKYLCLLAF